MFRVTFFCEDKHLAPAMHGLAGYARNLEAVPVANAATAPGGKVKAVASDAITLIVKELTKRGVTTFTPDLLRATVKKVGLNPNSWGYHIKQLKAAGVVTAAGKGNKVLYTLVKS